MKDFYFLLQSAFALGRKQGAPAARPADLVSGRALGPEADPEAATEAYAALLRLYPGNGPLRLAFAETLERQGDGTGALDQLLRIFESGGAPLRAHVAAGRLFRGASDELDTDAHPAPLARYLAALGVNASDGQPLTLASIPAYARQADDDPAQQSLLLAFAGDTEQARAVLEQAIGAGDASPALLALLAEVCEAMGETGLAALYRGHARYAQGQPGAAEAYAQALAASRLDLAGLRRYTNELVSSGAYAEAVAVSRRGLAAHPSDRKLWYHLLFALLAEGRTDEARATAVHGLRTGCQDLLLHRVRLLALPSLPMSTQEVEEARARFQTGVDELRARVAEADPEQAMGIATMNNFYLAYHNRDDRPLQEAYGHLLHEVVARRYPAYAEPPAAGGRDGRPLRVGYASPVICNHTVARFFLGWLQYRTPGAYEAYVYHLGENTDLITQLYANEADVFRGPLRSNVERAAEAIRKDELDVLVYLDVGQDARTPQLAAMRLAPVQCAAWGHPVTTGLPTVDYFLSSELGEPPGADAHYTETLVRLPGIGIATPRPRLLGRARSRSAWGLPEEAVVYLSPQSLFKYMPEHDWIYPAIAQEVPQSVFVFFRHGSDHLTELFYGRLQAAFDAAGRPIHKHVRLMPRVGYLKYLEAPTIADVFLDNPAWSGGMTALDAIGAALPVAAVAGPYFRSRQTASYLARLGLPEMAARDAEGLVDLAVRLGRDASYRERMRRALEEQRPCLFDDDAGVRGLEAFLAEVGGRG